MNFKKLIEKKQERNQIHVGVTLDKKLMARFRELRNEKLFLHLKLSKIFNESLKETIEAMEELKKEGGKKE
ncbi:hypothetical protein ES702_02320 [subsurface metagenome]